MSYLKLYIYLLKINIETHLKFAQEHDWAVSPCAFIPVFNALPCMEYAWIIISFNQVAIVLETGFLCAPLLKDTKNGLMNTRLMNSKICYSMSKGCINKMAGANFWQAAILFWESFSVTQQAKLR